MCSSTPSLAGRGDVVKDALKHLILPALVLSSYSLGVITRVMRAGMLEVLGEDYVRTARAKGVDERAVMIQHAARNSLIPTLTVIGLSFGGLLSGAVVTESVFSWPGLGLYAFRSATSLDFPAIMGVGIVVATVYVLVNLAGRPRLRVARSRVSGWGTEIATLRQVPVQALTRDARRSRVTRRAAARACGSRR